MGVPQITGLHIHTILKLSHQRAIASCLALPENHVECLYLYGYLAEGNGRGDVVQLSRMSTSSRQTVVSCTTLGTYAREDRSLSAILLYGHSIQLYCIELVLEK
jgi:hypothetical protein